MKPAGFSNTAAMKRLVMPDRLRFQTVGVDKHVMGFRTGPHVHDVFSRDMHDGLEQSGFVVLMMSPRFGEPCTEQIFPQEREKLVQHTYGKYAEHRAVDGQHHPEHEPNESLH